MKPFAVVDIGTNSIRLGVVQPEANHTYTILSQQKEVIRLGEGEFATNQLTTAAMDRGVLVLRKFADVARGYGVSDLTVLGTSALREAQNQAEFLERAEQEAGVEVHVISGAEEARLIYLGVVSGVDLGGQRVLVMDIGGGSTELAVGDSNGSEVLESLKLGAIRVAGIFTEGETGPIEPQLYRRIQEYARGVAIHSIQRVKQAGFDLMYGSSGTILNLAEIVARSKNETTAGARNYFVRLEDLEAAAARLCALNLEQRRKVPGINPERADIIVAGAAVLTSIMAAVDAPGLYTSERALREGTIVDRLGRVVVGGPEALLADSVRNRSVFQLARRCQFEEEHAKQVARISCMMFDQFKALGLHGFGDAERELLYYAAILHDIGGFVSYTDHQKHGYYLVRNSPLLGFDGTEILMLAAMVLHHRKGLPKRKEEAMADLSKRQREVVTILSTILRIAEAMDRGHLAEVAEVRCAVEGRGETLVIEIVSEKECHLELWGLENQKNAIREVFEKRLDARCSVPVASQTHFG